MKKMLFLSTLLSLFTFIPALADWTEWRLPAENSAQSSTDKTTIQPTPEKPTIAPLIKEPLNFAKNENIDPNIPQKLDYSQWLLPAQDLSQEEKPLNFKESPTDYKTEFITSINSLKKLFNLKKQKSSIDWQTINYIDWVLPEIEHKKTKPFSIKETYARLKKQSVEYSTVTAKATKELLNKVASTRNLPVIFLRDAYRGLKYPATCNRQERAAKEQLIKWITIVSAVAGLTIGSAISYKLAARHIPLLNKHLNYLRIWENETVISYTTQGQGTQQQTFRSYKSALQQLEDLEKNNINPYRNKKFALEHLKQILRNYFYKLNNDDNDLQAIEGGQAFFDKILALSNLNTTEEQDILRLYVLKIQEYTNNLGAHLDENDIYLGFIDKDSNAYNLLTSDMRNFFNYLRSKHFRTDVQRDDLSMYNSIRQLAKKDKKNQLNRLPEELNGEIMKYLVGYELTDQEKAALVNRSHRK